ncbi:hypothetical protein [Streptomyces jumonjinensis]|uniref:Large membrane protein n=1 Tax=Streptomyces jumonjinensis TaxID=1945 RepID=A0A646KG36_STRJU|nr:hypothetical protein [Streptomyces jumonjinensis]MQT01030.1 hypothetical protein [Streptomyces jumonjinensis]
MVGGENLKDVSEGAVRRRFPLIVSVAAVVLVASGGGVYLATAGSGGGGPAAESAAVRQDGGGGDAPRLSTEPDPGRSVAPGEPSPSGGIRYVAEGEFPRGPERAAVHRMTGTVSSAEVLRLARALGLAGTPQRSGGQWSVGGAEDGTGPVLRVETAAPGQWTFRAHGPSGGDDCRKGPSCPAGDPPANATGEPLSERAGKEAAAPVLAAAGQSGARLFAEESLGAVRIVNADPVVGGLTTYGWSTDLQIGADGRVVRGEGRLKKPVRGGEVAVVSADRTLARLNEGRRAGAGAASALSGCGPSKARDDRPRHDVPCGPSACASAVPLAGGGGRSTAGPCRAGTAPTAVPSPTAAPRRVPVAGAEFGLSVEYRDGTQSLVPSWLFRVAPGGDREEYTEAVPASADPSPYPSSKASVTVPPEEPSATPPSAGGVIQSYRVDGRRLTLTFWGGVCADYRATAAESGGRVTVRIVAPEPEPGEVCIELAKELTESVTLDERLGDRRVVDAQTGTEVPAGR